ncbi:lipid IV(A) palmitoyltransferase PagP [Legionella sp. CNM-4043-24]|uniref:lipid IV(A) palmitoyltransferase PagP n=1 Tax=Legionella sp. CNM-4043-24 TaxID=3421646 RepID=UPI00403AB087
MKKILTVLLLLFAVNGQAETKPCASWAAWPKAVCQRFHQIWTEGNNELYLSGYAWHNRYTYSPEKIKTYNENAWGGGLGKGLYDEKGDWHGLYAFGFSDSHKNFQPVAGYAFLKMAHLSQSLKMGAGFTVLVTARPDIFKGRPFPGALPWASITYRRATLSATYIPGAQGAGNVLYIVGKWTFDKL